ncbi:hypothetical protein U8P76_28090 (plasmid) [Rhizobium johnstonii]|nr:hypothetical protein U8P76_28090 [Rhizobium johnstonii]
MYNFLESTFGCVCRFGIYSDLLGYAKPNEAFFNEIIRSRGVAADDILHVGDDAILRLQGARSAGMRGDLVGKI